jgi:predicted dehydrogenase
MSNAAVKTIRVGVIGAGWWASTLHLPELKSDPRVTLGAVSRLGRAELEQVRASFGADAGYEDYREMLAREALDAVVVASPHTLHYQHASAALERGCHVLVEKPMTTRAAEARQLVALADETRSVLMVAYGFNFAPMVERARELLAKGAIGAVRHVNLHMASSLEDLFSGRGLLGARDAMFQPAASTWADPRNAGGYGWGQLTHALGVLFRITDLEPLDVFATTQLSSSGVDICDAATMRFTNGASGVLSGTALIPKHLPSQLDIRLSGSEGTLLLDLDKERLEVHRNDESSTIIPLPPGSGLYLRTAPVRAFVDICSGAHLDNPAPGIVGQRSTEVLDALYRSAASRQIEPCMVHTEPGDRPPRVAGGMPPEPTA